MFSHIGTILLSVSLAGNPIAPQAPSAPPQTAAPAAKPDFVFGLEDGTPVKLRLNRNLSSASDKTGDQVDFEVLEEVKVADLIVIPRGSIAWGTITEAEPKRRMGRGGKLNVNIDSVRLKDGQKTALRAAKDTKGGGHVGAMTGAMVATGIVFFPAAPLFLFMHGKDIAIPKGTEITAYVAGNAPLERAKFETGESSPAAGVNTLAPAQTTMSVTSAPAGADVQVDGSFVGSTPSSVSLAEGDHQVTVSKAGYKPWERKLKASGGTVSLNADLAEEK